MEDFQAKLEQYRLRKRRQQTINAFKERIKTGFKRLIMFEKKEVAISVEEDEQEEESNLIAKNVLSKTFKSEEKLSASDGEASDVEEDISPVKKDENKLLKYTLYIVYFLFWTTLYIIAIELQFGIVYLMISALCFICLNTRTGPKKDEISAYSVFNKNCEAIDGTLKAEQFERELFYGGVLGK